MQRKLHISTDLSLPQDTVTSTLIVYGGKGMGKTNFGSVLVEELSAAGLRWSVLDPLGVWWGLRHSSDGKGAGIECLVLGGSHADIPIEPTGGAIVADLVVDETANVVIDFSRKPSGEMWGIGERIRFVTDYAYRLFQRQGELVKGLRREPIFQMLDEAARYIPQVIPSGAAELAKCVSAWEQLVEEGRNIGVGIGLLTQRSARMNKSVSEVADAILSFRIVGPNSIGAITDWLGEHVSKDQIKVMVETIRSLERGRCLVVSPGWLKFEGVVGIRARHTFDSSATPKPGERAKRVHGEGAKPDLSKYVERMRATIEKAKADDPRELKKEIDRLKKEVKSVSGKWASPEKVVEKRVEVKVPYIPKDLVRYIDKIKKAVEVTVTSLGDISSLISETSDKISVRVGPTPDNTTRRFPPPPDKIKPEFRPVSESSNSNSNGNGSGKLRAGAERMLAALVQWSPEGMLIGQMRSHAGMKKSGTFNTYLSDLRKGDYIAERDGKLFATQPGIGYFGGNVPSAPQSTEEVLSVWEPKLREGARRMLRILVDAGGAPMSKDELSAKSNMAVSGTFNTYLSDLRTARLIETGRDGVSANRETLFL